MDTRQDSKNDKQDDLDLLPIELQRQTFFFCNRPSQVALANTCKSWYLKSKAWENDIDFTLASVQQQISNTGSFWVELEKNQTGSTLIQCSSFSKDNVLFSNEDDVLLFLPANHQDENWTGLASMTRSEFSKLGKKQNGMISFGTYEAYGKKYKAEQLIKFFQSKRQNRLEQSQAAAILQEIFAINNLFNKFSPPGDLDYFGDKNMIYSWYFKLEQAEEGEQKSREISYKILQQLEKSSLIILRLITPDNVAIPIQAVKFNDKFAENCNAVVSNYQKRLPNKVEAEDSPNTKRRKMGR